MSDANEFLDRHVLPYPVKFLTHRFVILATIALLVPADRVRPQHVLRAGGEQLPEHDGRGGQLDRAALRDDIRDPG